MISLIRGYKVRKKLNSLILQLGQVDNQIIKEDYLQLYDVYLKLSEKHQQNFFSRMVKIREFVEQEIANDKKMEVLLGRVNHGDYEDQEKNFHKFEETYQTLSKVLQDKYYTDIVHLRERLSSGR
tara:strand:- start:677 stop:1051 length:375 start_codon:yes stop_codon:yes gene_type:complete